MSLQRILLPDFTLQVRVQRDGSGDGRVDDDAGYEDRRDEHDHEAGLLAVVGVKGVDLRLGERDGSGRVRMRVFGGHEDSLPGRGLPVGQSSILRYIRSPQQQATDKKGTGTFI